MDAPPKTIRRAKALRRTMSLPEVLLWQGLRKGELKFRRQHPFGPYILDFYCDEAKLAVEIDGSSHNMGDQPASDVRRDAWLSEQGVETLRLSAVDVLKGLDATLQVVAASAKGRKDCLPPR